MTEPPKIKTISTKVTPVEVREALNTMGRYFAMLDKAGGAPSAADLVSSGLASYDSAGRLQPVDGVAQTPTAPTGFGVTGSFAKIFVEWDNPSYFGHSYTEIWRAQVNDLGQAVKVGVSSWNLYPDQPPSNVLAEKYYYWVRHVNRNGIPGPYNAISGSLGNTADDPDYVLDLLLDAKWKASTARALNFLGYPSRPNGYAYKVTVAGTSGTTEPTWPTTLTQTVTDGGITWRCEAAVSPTPPFEVGLVNGVVKTVIKALMIGDATITNAMIRELAADKITTGYLAAARIAAETIISSMIKAGDIAGDRIAARTITGNNIAIKTLTAASGVIGDLAVDTLQLANNAVIIPVFAYATDAVQLAAGTTHVLITAPPVTVPAGTTVAIIANCFLYYWAAANSDLNMYVYRNGVLLYTLGSGNGYVIWQEIFNCQDTPGAGTFTYDIRFSSASVIYVKARRSINVMGCKK